MRRLLLLFVMLFSIGLVAQQPQGQQGAKTMKVTYLGESPSLRQMAREAQSRPGPTGTYIVPNKLTKTGMIESIQNPNQDPVIQRGGKLEPSSLNAPTLMAPALKTSFDGGSNADNAAINGGFVAPPDTQGDVGPNHYVQMVNSVTTIFDKSGNTLLGPVQNSFFFQNLDPRLAGTNDGDPVALYDQFADRWIVSQFAVSAGAPYFMLIAVSTTNDPTGTYHQYAIDYGNDFPDYPKLGVWNEAIYITTRDFLNGASFAGFSVAAINKIDMYAGLPTTAQRFEIDNPEFDGIVPADADGTTPPPAGEPHYCMYLSASGNVLNLITTSIDFDDAANSTISFSTIPVAPYSFFQTQVPQPNGQTLDALPFFLMFRLQYINFGTHASMVVNHSVQEVTGGDFGIRWYEFRDTGAPWAVYQQGTYLPDDGLNRWMGSIAMNLNGDIALGYSVAGETLAPSIRFVGQTADQSGTGIMNISETSLLEGTLSSRGTNRWGDYSMMSMDPSDDDFWFTTEYIAVDQGFSGWGTNISEFGLEGGPEAICQDITVQLDAAGNATITADQVDNGSTGDGGVTLSIDNDTFTCENVGLNSVVLTVTDGNGVVSNCTATVTVEDNVAPTAICQNISIPLNGAGEASITAEQIDGGSSDACGVASLSLDITDFTTADLGDNTVTLTVTDESGNSSTCTATVTVVSERPIIGVDPTSFDVTLQTDDTTTENLTINNTGDADLDFSISVTNNLVAAEFAQNVATTNAAIANNGFTQVNVASDNSGLSGLISNNNTLNALLGDLYATDFESFTLGDINGQMGWFANVASVWNVSDAAPFEGAQHLRGTSSGSGVFTFALTPNFTAGTEDVSTMTARVNLQGSGVTWEIAPQDPAAGLVVTRLAFNGDGTVSVLDGAVGDFVPLSGVSVPSGYFDVRISVERNTSELLVFFNNDPVYAGTSFGTIIENVAFLSSQEAVGSTFDIDNLNVTDGVIEAPNFLTFVPENGTVSPGGSAVVAVTFDATGLEPAVYSSTINIGSNDPDTPNVDVPAQLTVVGEADTDIVINEFLANYPGADDFEFLEVFGTPNTDYSSLTLLEIEGDTGAGVIDEVIPVGTTDANGIWLTTFANELENGTVTFLLVSGFTGSVGDDLDTDDNGNFEVTPWDSIIDDVGKSDGGANDQVYSSTILVPGFDGGSGAPAGASRIPNGTDTDALEDWTPNDPDGAGLPGLTGTPEPGEALNTPGEINEIIEFNNLPIAICQDITVQLDASGNATILPSDVDGGSSDVEGIASLSVSQSSFTCTDLGPNNITLTVTDTDGEEASCTAVVTVVDELPPVVACKDITVELGFDGTVTIAPEDVVQNEDSELLALLPWASIDANTLYTFNYSVATDAISVKDNPLGGLPGNNLAIARNPVDGQVYVLLDETAAIGENIDRSLYPYDMETATIGAKIASVVSATGDTDPNVMAFGNDGTLYIGFGLGDINTFDFSTNTTSAFANVGVPAGSGMTFDTDNDRLIYATVPGSGVTSLVEIDLTGTVSPLFDVTSLCSNMGQALAYVGQGKLIASGTGDCNQISVIDLTSQGATDILSPLGTSALTAALKDFLFNGNETTDNCGDPTITLSQDTFTEAGEFEVTVTATDASGNSSSCTATVTVEEGSLVGPIIGVDPDSFDVTQAPDVTTSEPLTISNTGDADLDFDITVTNGATSVDFIQNVQKTNSATAKLGLTTISATAAPNATNINSVKLVNGDIFAIAGDLFAEDFEDFTIGDINGQMGWGSQPANIWNISDTNPDGGSQHIRAISDGSGGGGLLPIAQSPVFGAGLETVMSFSARVNIEGTGVAWELVPQNTDVGLIVTRIAFLGDGTILIADGNTGFFELVPVTVPTGYFSVALTINGDTLEMNLYIDGVLAYTGAGFTGIINNVAVLSDLAAVGSTMDVDNIEVTDGDITATSFVSVTPESGTVAPGGSSILDVTFDSNGLVPDVYSANINVGSNDPNNPSIDVPVTLTVEPNPAPGNDLCGDALPIACGETVSGTTIDATFDDVGFCGTSNTAPGVWYTFTGLDGITNLSTCNQAGYDTKISVFTGSCGDLICVDGNDDGSGCTGFTSDLSIETSSDTTYYVLVHGFGTATGTFDLTLTCPEECSITDIAADNLSECDDLGTPSPDDDIFTADITVTFENAPATGTLDLTGDGTASVDVGSLDSATSHTFVGVELSSDGGEIALVAAFSENGGCSFENSNVGIAPEPCSLSDCPDFLPNEDPGIVINSGGGLFLGLDAAFGTSDTTNGSPCALALQNNDGGQPFANFRIPLDLSTYGINAGDELFISLDALNNGGIARVEVLQNNQPNTALASNTYSGPGWETYSTTITVPGGLSSIDIWLYSNYLSSSPGTAYYDNLVIQNLTSGGGNVDPIANAGLDQTVTDSDGNGSQDVTLDGSGSFDPDGAIVSYSWSDGTGEIATGETATATLPVGTTTVTLTVTDDDGATDTDTVTITVNPAAGNIDPVANAGPDQSVSDGDSSGSEDVTLDGTASFDPDGSIVSYVWSIGATNIATGATPTVTLPVGTSTITLMVMDDEGATDTDTVDITVTDPTASCPDDLPNEDPSIPLAGQGGFQGLDSFQGTNVVTNGSPCALMITNNDGGQPFANFRIPIDLATYGINSGDELFISLDGNSSEGVARIEVNQNNSPNTALAFNTYTGGGWSTYSTTVTVPAGITSINLWLYSNYLSSAPGTAYYDNLIVTNLTAGGGNIDPVADAGPDQTVVDSDENGSEDVTLDGSGSFDVDGTIVSYDWSNGSTGVSPTASFPLGTTTVTLTVTDDDGATDTDTVDITVSGPTNLDPIANAGPDQTVVDTDENGSEDVTLDGSGSFDLDGTIVDYAWSNGSTGVSPTATFPVGETTVTLTVTDDEGATATDTVVITVVDPGAPCPDDLPNEDSIVLTGDGGFQGLDSFQGTSSVTNGSPCALEVTNNDVGQPFANYRIPIPLAANGINPGDQLFISLDGNSSQGVARIEVNQDNSPNTALAFNTYVGGWSTFSQTITVPSGITSLNIWLYSNYLDFGSGGTAYYDNLVVRNLGPLGLSPIASRASLNSMRLSPNPANVTSNLSFDKPEEIKEILIFDMAGRMVQRFDADEIRRGEHYEMDVYSMPVGTYIIRSRSIEGIEYSGQMVIER